MYVIGTSEYEFINVKSKTMTDRNFVKMAVLVENVVYECELKESTFFPDYESAVEILNEIQERKSEILFQNQSIIGEILDRGKEFDVDKLKVYRLIPKLCE